MNLKWTSRQDFWKQWQCPLSPWPNPRWQFLSEPPFLWQALPRVRPCTELEVMFPGWQGPSSKQATKWHRDGGNESSREMGRGWCTLLMVCNRRYLTSKRCFITSTHTHPRALQWPAHSSHQINGGAHPPTKPASNWSNLRLSTATQVSTFPFLSTEVIN